MDKKNGVYFLRLIGCMTNVHLGRIFNKIDELIPSITFFAGPEVDDFLCTFDSPPDTKKLYQAGLAYIGFAFTTMFINRIKYQIRII